MSLPSFEKTLKDKRVLQEGPDPARRATAKRAVLRAAAIGVAAGAFTTAATSASGAASAATTTGASAGATAGTVGAAATSAKLFTVATVAKIVVVAAIGLGGAAAVVLAPSARRVEPALANAPASNTLDAAPTDAMPARATEVVPSVSIADLPSAPSPDSRPPTTSASADPLASEARLLEEARGCLRAFDTRCVHARLREHSRQFPAGVLGDEAEILAIELARAESDEARAHELATSFIRRHPASPYARRVRAFFPDLPDLQE